MLLRICIIYVCIYHPPLKTYLDIIDISYIWFCQQWGTLVVHPHMQNAMFAFTMILGGRYIIYPPRESGYCKYRPRLRLGRYLQYPDYLGRYIINISNLYCETYLDITGIVTKQYVFRYTVVNRYIWKYTVWNIQYFSISVFQY